MFHYEQFLLLPQCFQKLSAAVASTSGKGFKGSFTNHMRCACYQHVTTEWIFTELQPFEFPYIYMIHDYLCQFLSNYMLVFNDSLIEASFTKGDAHIIIQLLYPYFLLFTYPLPIDFATYSILYHHSCVLAIFRGASIRRNNNHLSWRFLNINFVPSLSHS